MTSTQEEKLAQLRNRVHSKEYPLDCDEKEELRTLSKMQKNEEIVHFGEKYTSLTELLYDVNIINLHSVLNDEYESEARLILKELEKLQYRPLLPEVYTIVAKIFAKQFYPPHQYEDAISQYLDRDRIGEAAQRILASDNLWRNAV